MRCRRAGAAVSFQANSTVDCASFYHPLDKHFGDWRAVPVLLRDDVVALRCRFDETRERPRIDTLSKPRGRDIPGLELAVVAMTR